MPSVTVPGSHGRAIRINAGETVRVVNTHGTQVVDFWAIRADRPEIAMSMQHSRDLWSHLRPHPGDEMLDEERSVILTLRRGHQPRRARHVHCGMRPVPIRATRCRTGLTARAVSNFAEALAELSVVRNAPVPAPLNLFMNIPWDLDGNITFEPTVSAPGDSVLFRAEIDMIVIASACPQDIIPINGPGGGTPVDVELVSSA